MGRNLRDVQARENSVNVLVAVIRFCHQPDTISHNCFRRHEEQVAVPRLLALLTLSFVGGS